ncbi:MAG: hypothetical protein RR410_09155 [Alistipes sp.]
MKKILTFCIGLLFMTSCEKDEQPYNIWVEKSQYTLSDQGKANISVTVAPEDFDISKLEIGYYDIYETGEDPKLPGVGILSVTKDAQASGKWTVVIGLKVEGKPYAPNPKYSYKTDATVDFYALRASGEAVHTDKFKFSLDIKSSSL